MPGPEDLDPPYQPSAYMPGEMTLLQRVRFVPQGHGAGPWPVVLTIHPGNYYQYDEYGVPSQRWADQQLANAGFLVFSVDHRLAPDPDGIDSIGSGLILGQYPHDGSPRGIASGRPPQQSNDIKQQILAAYYDSHSNHQIFLVGGSSGATHALWCALDRAATVPLWPLPIGSIKAVATLSGPCDLSYWVGDNPNNLLKFEEKIKNYTDTTTNTGGDKTYQKSVSPISLVSTASEVPPCRLFVTDGDPVPHQQSDEMYDAIKAFPGPAEVTIHNSNLHAFNYWRTHEDNNGPLVGDDVTAFLLSHVQ